MKKIIILSLSFFLLFILANIAEAALNCSFNSSSCSGGYVPVLKMSSASNAHAELPNQSNFTNYICCSGLSAASCTGGTAFLKLSAVTNAHVERTDSSNFTYNSCLTPLSGETISCTYSDYSCSVGYTCLASISGSTNAHVAQCGQFTTQVCCTSSISEIFRFNLVTNPTSRSVFRNSQTSTTITLTRVPGTIPAENVIFNSLTVPSGVTYQFSPTSCIPNDSCSSTLTFTISSSATLVTNYNINICGTATGGYSACQTFYLTITDSVNPITAPSVTTYAANPVGTTTATLNASLDYMGGVSSCLTWFNYKKSTDATWTKVCQTTKSSTGSFSCPLTGLTSGATYYFEAFAENGGSW